MNKNAPLPLKTWSKGELTADDWNFEPLISRIESERAARRSGERWIPLYRALQWELDRELGSGNKSFQTSARPDNPKRMADEFGYLAVSTADGDLQHIPIEVGDWYKDSLRINGGLRCSGAGLHPGNMGKGENGEKGKARERSAKANLNRFLPMLFQWNFAELARHITEKTTGVSHGINPIVALEIPSDMDEEELVTAFRGYLRQRNGPIRERYQKRKAGRKVSWETWFLNLAYYRLSSAGYTRAEALAITSPMRKTLGHGETSAPNFAAAKRSILVEIGVRYKYLIACANTPTTNAAGSGAGPDAWRSFFIKP